LHDRAALPDPFGAAGRAAPVCAEAATDTERLLVEVWRSLLKVEKIGVLEDFFNIGGYSMISLRGEDGGGTHRSVDGPTVAVFQQPARDRAAARFPRHPPIPKQLLDAFPEVAKGTPRIELPGESDHLVSSLADPARLFKLIIERLCPR
jgi:hypothetical protein